MAEIFSREEGGGREGGGIPPTWSYRPPSKEIVNFLGSIFPISTCSLYRRNIFSTIFHVNLNMCFMHTFPTELKQIIYHLSSDAFSYIISTHFLHAEYICCMHDPCLITWTTFIIKRLWNLSLIKVKLKYCVWKDLHKFFA